MTNFEAVKAITGVKEFSEIVYDLVKKSGSPGKLEEALSWELPETAVRILKAVADAGRYPISLEGIGGDSNFTTK